VFLTSGLGGGEWSASRPNRFNPEKGPRYTHDRKFDEPQSGSGCGGEEKISLTLLRNETAYLSP